MNTSVRIPFLFSAESFINLVHNSATPIWQAFAEDENIHFLSLREKDSKTLSDIAGDKINIESRKTISIQSFTEKHKDFGLIICEGIDPDPEGLSATKKPIRIYLTFRRKNSDLRTTLASVVAQNCDLIVSDFLPEESVDSENVSLHKKILSIVPEKFSLLPPLTPKFCQSPTEKESDLLWVIDPSSMASGGTNSKITSILSLMKSERNQVFLNLATGVIGTKALIDKISSAQGILAFTGDPVLGHFLISAGIRLGTPIVFPLEEPCSPFRFTEEELTHYIKYNNYGRSGLSLRGLITKAIETVLVKDETIASCYSPKCQPITQQWVDNLHPEKPTTGIGKTLYQTLQQNQNTPIDDSNCIDQTPHNSSEQGLSLIPKPWLTHPTFVKGLKTLYAISTQEKSITLLQKTSDLITEPLLSGINDLNWSDQITQPASTLIQAINLNDPQWLKRNRQDILKWWKDGSPLDSAKALSSAYANDYNEINPKKRAKRIEEYQNVLNLLCLQVGSGKITGWEQHLTIRLVCALNLIDDKKEIIAKLITTHPTNSNSYHLQLDLFGLLNKTVKAEELKLDYNNIDNLNLSLGNYFICVGLLSNLMKQPNHHIELALNKGYFLRWSQRSAFDVFILAIITGNSGMHEESEILFKESIDKGIDENAFSEIFNEFATNADAGNFALSANNKKHLKIIFSKLACHLK
jgi:hypothetical protein